MARGAHNGGEGPATKLLGKEMTQVLKLSLEKGCLIPPSLGVGSSATTHVTVVCPGWSFAGSLRSSYLDFLKEFGWNYSLSNATPATPRVMFWLWSCGLCGSSNYQQPLPGLTFHFCTKNSLGYRTRYFSTF